MKRKILTMAMMLVAAMVLAGCQHNSSGDQPTSGMTNSNGGSNPGATNSVNTTTNPSATSP